MTLSNRAAAQAYLFAKDDMPKMAKPRILANIADRMAGSAFDEPLPPYVKKPSGDDMMSIETSIWVALCKANDIDWRLVQEPA